MYQSMSYEPSRAEYMPPPWGERRTFPREREEKILGEQLHNGIMIIPSDRAQLIPNMYMYRLYMWNNIHHQYSTVST